jgi:hypothetical protein
LASNAEFLERGNVEPHGPLLKQPPEDQLLYKIMKAGDLVRSVEHGYLHFHRVDSYRALNETIGDEPGRSALMVGGAQCRQIFKINYGLIDYVDASIVRANADRLPNPVL